MKQEYALPIQLVVLSVRLSNPIVHEQINRAGMNGLNLLVYLGTAAIVSLQYWERIVDIT